MRKYYLAALLLLVGALGWSQTTKLKKADRYMELLDYRAAIQLYQEVVAKNDAPEIKAKIAAAYRKLHDYVSAEQWYSQLANLPEPNPTYLFYYGEMQQRNGKCTEAEEWYKRYLRLRPYDPRKKHLQRACAYAEELLQKNSNVYHIQLPSFNAGSADLAPTFYKDGLVFASLRRDSASQKPKSHLDLYQVSIQVQDSNLNYSSPTLFSQNLNARYGEGITTFNTDFTEMYFTRNRQNTKPEEPARLEIMQAQNPNDSAWSDLKPLPFNSANYSVAHPALTPDGQKLYFSSDMPGGFGGKDLYFSEKSNGQWGPPVNLGPMINTEGDELYPFYQDNRLYFASDGQIGLGGLDIFYVNDLENSDWSEVENLGAPINSISDDYGLIVVAQGNFGYFSSNRPGGTGADDIYSFFKTVLKINFDLTDASTGNPLQGVVIKSTCEENIPVQWTSQQPFVQLREGQCCEFLFSQPGYQNLTRRVCAADAKNAPLKIALQPNENEAFGISGVVYDQMSGVVLAGVIVQLTSDNCGGKFTTITDASGKFYLAAKKNCCYKLRLEKPDFFATTLDERLCPDQATLQKSIFLQPFSIHSTNKITSDTSKTRASKEVASFKRSAKEYEGSTSIAYLINIYYDLGKTNIRPDAASELTKLLKILKDNPNLIVEISAHTDAQGDSRKNLPLSQKRAEAVVNWLIQRGIQRDRLVAKGYGETQLVNNCDDGIPCSEQEHQLNRRTEFRVLGKLK